MKTIEVIEIWDTDGALHYDELVTQEQLNVLLAPFGYAVIEKPQREVCALLTPTKETPCAQP